MASSADTLYTQPECRHTCTHRGHRSCSPGLYASLETTLLGRQLQGEHQRHRARGAAREPRESQMSSSSQRTARHFEQQERRPVQPVLQPEQQELRYRLLNKRNGWEHGERLSTALPAPLTNRYPSGACDEEMLDLVQVNHRIAHLGGRHASSDYHACNEVVAFLVARNVCRSRKRSSGESRKRRKKDVICREK